MKKKEISEVEAPIKKEAPKKAKLWQHTWVIVTAAVLAVVILVGVMVTVAMVSGGLSFREILGLPEKSFDYLNEKLDKYVSIKESDYKDYDIEIDIRRPDSLNVENKVLQLLAKNKGGTLYDGNYQTKKAVTPGDRAYVYYSGYLKDENGKRIQEIASANNFIESTQDNPTAVEVGGGKFVLGFELGLVGQMPSDFKVITGGNVEPGDIVYATATYVEESGLIYENTLIRIDLGDPDHENKWGENVISHLQGKGIGLINDDVISFTCPESKDKITYAEITVDYVIRGAYEPIVIETHFPHDYEDAALRNKTVYYDVFIKKVLCYENAEFDDEFVRNTLKLTEDSLSEYEGSLTERCRAKYLSEFMEEYQENCDRLAEDLMWERLSSKAEIKKYPEKEIERVYEDYLYSYTLDFANDSDLGYDMDEYMTQLFGLENGSDWQAHLYENVRSEIKEKLIFYYIIDVEGLTPKDEEFDKLYRDELELDFEYYLKQEGKEKPSGDEYETALREYEEKVIDYYGKEFYIDTVYYNYASKKILEFANVKYV